MDREFVGRSLPSAGWRFLGIVSAILPAACMSPTATEHESSAPPEKTSQIASALQAVNLRATIRRLGNLVEIEVNSDKPFLVASMPPVLVVGGKAFSHSRHPDDGRTDTLIFSVDTTEFDALPDGAEISVGYLSPSARLIPGLGPGPAAIATAAAP